MTVQYSQVLQQGGHANGGGGGGAGNTRRATSNVIIKDRVKVSTSCELYKFAK